MKVFSIVNQKGGSGKTTTAAALAHTAARTGKKVLVIDCDPQANLSLIIGAELDVQGTNEFLAGAQPEDVMQDVADNITVIAAAADLQAAGEKQGDALRLAAALKPLKKEFDICIIDTPPTPGVLQYTALQASDTAIIPLTASIFSLQGIGQITSTIGIMQKTNPALTIGGIIITQFNKKHSAQEAMAKKIEEAAGKLQIPFLGYIRYSAAAERAAASGQSIFARNWTNAAKDYKAVAQKIGGITK